MFVVPSRIFCYRGGGPFSALSSSYFSSSRQTALFFRKSFLSSPLSYSSKLFCSTASLKQQKTKKMAVEPTQEELQYASENIVRISKEVEATREEYKHV